VSAALAFELPERLEAHAPPKRRDDVRMLVAHRGDGELVHARFRHLPSFVREGDLVVVNTSATLPAALTGKRANGEAVDVHFSTPVPDDDRHWVVELRRAFAPLRVYRPETLELPAGARVALLAPYLAGPRLWIARLELPLPLDAYLAEHGRPIRYRYVPDEHPLADYQTIFAAEPGSAEMPSAGRPFTHELVTELTARGVLFAPVTLHTGVSSPEEHEPPYPERFHVPAGTARLVNAVRQWGGRIIAVGTTVVRALETAARADGTLEPAAGWTHVVVTPERGPRAVDGLLTGWHEPGASHLQLLDAVAGRELVARSYRAALEQGYLWHEFGDVHLILPSRVERG
jgi:S-adenosylmethionine:tRNA ribosyltransferase-isomerase